jgi:hypothetical protein
MSWFTAIADGVMAGLDKVWFTDEEKSEARQKGSDTLLKFWEVIANENTEQSKARRELAKMTFKVYFSLLLMAVAVYGFDVEYAKFIFSVAGVLTVLVTGIGAIYFGPQQISKIWKKKD